MLANVHLVGQLATVVFLFLIVLHAGDRVLIPIDDAHFASYGKIIISSILNEFELTKTNGCIK